MRLPIGWAVGIGVVAISALAYWHVQDDVIPHSEQPLLPVTKTETIADTVVPANSRNEEINYSRESTAQELEETELVHGIRVRKDRNCTVQLKYLEKSDGTLVEAYNCEPNDPKEQDIYDTYSYQTLATLAYSDAHAAHVLSKRLHETDRENALKLAIQSTAMSGDSMPINWLAQNYPLSSEHNGEVILQTVEDRYVMSGVIAVIDGIQDGHIYWSQKARDHEPDGINIEALDQRVNAIVAEIERLKQKFGPD